VSKQKTAYLTVGYEELERRLGLRENVRIIGVSSEALRRSIALVVEGEGEGLCETREGNWLYPTSLRDLQMKTQPLDFTLPQWRYEPAGDSDGEKAGIDHFVVDEHGQEIACPRNAAIAKLIALAPHLLQLCLQCSQLLCNGAFSRESKQIAENIRGIAQSIELADLANEETK